MFVDRRDLAEALGRLKPLVKKPLNPVLGCVLMEAITRPDGEWLELTATDTHQTLSLEIACERGSGEDFALVSLAPLAAFVTQDTSDRLTLSLAQGRLVVEGKTSVRIALKGDESLFPAIPEEMGGEAVDLPSEIVPEAVAIRGLVEKESRNAWPSLVHLVEREGKLDLCAGAGRAFFWRRGLEAAVPKGFAVGLTAETAAMLTDLAGPASFVAGEHRLLISAQGFRLAQRNLEGGQLPEGRLSQVAKFAEEEGEWEELASVAEILPVLKAVTMEAELRAPLHIYFEGERTLASVRTDAVEAEGCLPGRWPRHKTGYPEDLIAILKALNRVAGPEGKIEVAQLQQHFLRFRTEGALGFVSGMI